MRSAASSAQIVKSVVLVCDGAYVLALVPGDRRADEAGVAGAVGAHVARLARPEEVVEATGFEPGGVAPFPHHFVREVLLDTVAARPAGGLDRGRDGRSHGGSDLRRPAAPGEGTVGRPDRRWLDFTAHTAERSDVQETEKIWMNGELVDWADAKIHIGTHALHYGSGVFEGVRCYDTPRGPAVFRLGDHFQRLHNSAQLLYMQIPYSVGELTDACNDLLAANALPECYIRPIAFYGYGQLGVAARDNPVEVAIMSWPWGAYLGDDALRNGIRAKISSWQRIGANVIPHVSKATGVYINSLLAVTEANNAGYDEAILLTGEGTVADGSGENIFVVRDGVLYTPDLATGILPGITRNSIIELADDLGYDVVEKALIRSDLYLADEVFMCGTAAEVTPLRSIDDHEIGVGEVTRALQNAYLDTVRGKKPQFAHWLDYVPALARG